MVLLEFSGQVVRCQVSVGTSVVSCLSSEFRWALGASIPYLDIALIPFYRCIPSPPGSMFLQFLPDSSLLWIESSCSLQLFIPSLQPVVLAILTNPLSIS